MGKEDVAQTYNGLLLSHRKNEIMPFSATWMDLEIITLSEVSQKEKDKYHVISLTLSAQEEVTNLVTHTRARAQETSDSSI